ncbi:hypothetical protein BDY19DRAFT_1054671 [Irpex rosettiformis]|uniref:Uncharacterized protein n=1 Tax=Irpex rosettiformis TaxID=378272 RepID=A0ACB8UD50_9APHY|nr:hypothetical protein BDY19DRAFT_1054671 [Irpex rosettiformis]
MNQIAEYRLVPQHYPPAAAGFQPLPSVFFTAGNGAQCAINVEAACLGQLGNLDNGNQPCIVGDKLRIGLRVGWPALLGWDYRNLAATHANAAPYTYKEFLNSLANHIRKFYDEMLQNIPIGPDPDPFWMLQNVPFEELYVSELRHVTAGKWQPILYRRIAAPGTQ